MKRARALGCGGFALEEHLTITPNLSCKSTNWRFPNLYPPASSYLAQSPYFLIAHPDSLAQNPTRSFHTS